MSVSTKFKNFCDNIRINDDNVNKISIRYKAITKRLNLDFWNSESETNHSLYVGSYGRDTDIHVSDVDILMQLPWSIHEKYDKYSNGQSALLQAVRDSLRNRYETTHIKGDGQVVQINFTDGISFEILPAFLYDTGRYCYPDTNNGGSWKTTDPKKEIQEIRERNEEWNYNLKRLCRMTRVWKDNCDVPMGGLLIDTLCYNFLENWGNKDKSYVFYDWMVRDFFEFLKNQDENQQYWLAVGSNQYVWRKGKFEYKAKLAYNNSLEAIKYEEEDKDYSANQKWKEIFGSKFTG